MSDACGTKVSVDLAVLVDSSSGVHSWSTLVTFIVSLLNWFTIGPSSTRVALVQVGSPAAVSLYLDQVYDRLTLYSAVRNNTVIGGTRYDTISPVSTIDRIIINNLFAINRISGPTVSVSRGARLPESCELIDAGRP